jgi:hypothetical protein
MQLMPGCGGTSLDATPYGADGSRHGPTQKFPRKNFWDGSAVRGLVSANARGGTGWGWGGCFVEIIGLQISETVIMAKNT